MTNKEIKERYSADSHDVEQMQFDNRNNNFSPDDSDSYIKSNIVRTSIINGQRKQAIKQAKEYNLNYQDILEDMQRDAAAFERVVIVSTQLPGRKDPPNLTRKQLQQSIDISTPCKVKFPIRPRSDV